MGMEVTRDAASVQLLVQLGTEQGLSAAQCLEGSRIDPAALLDAGNEVAAAQEMQVIRNLLRHVGADRGLGLQAGLRLRASTHGILGFAMISSATLREALSVMLRYLDLTYAYCDVRIEDRGDELQLLLDAQAAPADLRQFLVERSVGGAYAIAHELLGMPPPVMRLEFDFPAPVYASRFLALSGIAPRFDAGRNLIVSDARRLAQPLPQANALTQRLCEEQCRLLLNRRRQRSGLAETVRSRLLRTPESMPDIDEVASALHITGRTLRRRLEDEGTSYRALVDELRCALAEEWLSAQLSVEEVATRLGFSEPSSFIRAFKRWTGRTPGAGRRTTAKQDSTAS